MYSNILLETKLKKIQTQRQIRLSYTYLINEEFNLSSFVPGEKGGAINAISTGILQGSAESVAKKSAEVGVKKLFNKYGIKSIPGIGSIAAAISALAEGSLFLRDLYRFSTSLQEKAMIDLSGVSSILGEYTLVDASAEDLNKIAEALSHSNMSKEDAEELYTKYTDAINRFKYFLVDLSLAIKEISAGLSLGVALSISILPVETAFKYLLFEVHNLLNRVKNSSPEILETIIDIMFGSTHFLPIIGFLLDSNRVSAMSKIDDEMSRLAERGSREIGLDTLRHASKDSKRMYDIIDTAGKEIADSISKVKFESHHYDLKRMQVLSGINWKLKAVVI